MMHPKVLSEIQGLGRVSRCSGCPDLHLKIGPVDLRIPESALEGLSSMMGHALDELRLEQVQVVTSSDIQMPSSSYHWTLS